MLSTALNLSPLRFLLADDAGAGKTIMTVAPTLAQLREERGEVEALLARARRLADEGGDSKFEKLRGVLRDPAFAREKFIVFTEHRDTAEFLVRRLEGLGFTGQVASIHGGLDYRAREAQVDLFRRPPGDGGANYLVATDAAGEGINLQFCWLMVNYDVPWNPARLEQRMGRIHRYGQRHDPVVVVNLVAGETREGRVLKTLLDKLEAIRRELQSDKVFDVVGRLFEDVPLKAYLEMAATDEGAGAAVDGIRGRLTAEQVRALADRERARFGGRRRQGQPARAAGGDGPGTVPPPAARLRPPLRHRRGAAGRSAGRGRPRRRVPARPGAAARPRPGARRDGDLPRRARTTDSQSTGP